MPRRALATADAEGRFEAEGWRVRKPVIQEAKSRELLHRKPSSRALSDQPPLGILNSFVGSVPSGLLLGLVAQQATGTRRFFALASVALHMCPL